MAFQVSPGVQVKEIDLTNVVPAVSTSIGAMAGVFQWGPVNQVVTVSSEKQLVQVFGKPKSGTQVATDFFKAAQFLQYGNTLRVVRVETTNLNATDSGTGIKIMNDEHAESVTVGSNLYAARYPGTLGNSLKVSICPASSTAFAAWAYKGVFDSAPSTSSYASSKNGANDELHIVVVDEDGAWTGEAGTVLESFAFVSQASDAKASDGTNNYYMDVLNDKSDYIRVLANDNTNFVDAGDEAANTTFTVPANAVDDSLSGGVDDNTPTGGEVLAGYDFFKDAETIEVNLIIGGCAPSGEDNTTYVNGLIAIAESRRDCVVFVSPEQGIADNADTIVKWVNGTAPYGTSITSSSYAVIDSTHLYVYDKYNDKYLWVPASASVAGLCAKTDDVADAWFSPAGFNRGQILGVTKIALNPNKTERDELYKARVNPIVSFPGEGTVLYGDKTAQTKPSAFDRINVRRLFIVLEKAIATASKYQLFEFNDEFTRAMFRNMVEPFLRDVKGRRGITDFLVVCDETNNTGEVIDTNRFVADLYIKPARSINFITLNFIATRTGVEFSEIVGQ